MWKVSADRKQAEAVDVKFGLIKRHIICMVVMYHTEELLLQKIGSVCINLYIYMIFIYIMIKF